MRALELLMLDAQERQAERQAARERVAIAEWNRRAQEWKAQFCRDAIDAFGVDFIAALALDLHIGRERHAQIRGIVTYGGRQFELSQDKGWTWRRVDNDDAAEYNVGPIARLEPRDRQWGAIPVDERQDLLLCALAELYAQPMFDRGD